MGLYSKLPNHNCLFVFLKSKYEWRIVPDVKDAKIHPEPSYLVLQRRLLGRGVCFPSNTFCPLMSASKEELREIAAERASGRAGKPRKALPSEPPRRPWLAVFRTPITFTASPALGPNTDAARGGQRARRMARLEMSPLSHDRARRPVHRHVQHLRAAALGASQDKPRPTVLRPERNFPAEIRALVKTAVGNDGERRPFAFSPCLVLCPLAAFTVFIERPEI